MAYAPEIVHKPLLERREHLEKGWGFRCTCPRCRAEEMLPASFQAAAEMASAAARPEPPGALITGLL